MPRPLGSRNVGASGWFPGCGTEHAIKGRGGGPSGPRESRQTWVPCRPPRPFRRRCAPGMPQRPDHRSRSRRPNRGKRLRMAVQADVSFAMPQSRKTSRSDVSETGFLPCATKLGGGEGGIRTPDTLASMPHFECGAINHSATSPKSPFTALLAFSVRVPLVAGDTGVTQTRLNPHLDGPS
jgi:hypothetical protein